MSGLRRSALVLLCAALGGASGLSSQSLPPAADRVPPPVFTDPQRVAKLESAFPEIDRLFRAFAERSRVPGIAYGIVIDGRLAHSGAAGVRDVRTKDAGGCRHRVPHRVDDEELHGALHPAPPRRRQALARRPGGTVRPRTGRPRLSDRRLAPHHDQAPAVPRGGLSRGQPLGRPPAGRHRRRDGGDDDARDPVLDGSRHGVRILELRVRDSRPDRLEGLGDAVPPVPPGDTS